MQYILKETERGDLAALGLSVLKASEIITVLTSQQEVLSVTFHFLSQHTHLINLDQSQHLPPIHLSLTDVVLSLPALPRITFSQGEKKGGWREGVIKKKKQSMICVFQVNRYKKMWCRAVLKAQGTWNKKRWRRTGWEALVVKVPESRAKCQTGVCVCQSVCVCRGYVGQYDSTQWSVTSYRLLLTEQHICRAEWLLNLRGIPFWKGN